MAGYGLRGHERPQSVLRLQYARRRAERSEIDREWEACLEKARREIDAQGGIEAVLEKHRAANPNPWFHGGRSLAS